MSTMTHADMMAQPGAPAAPLVRAEMPRLLRYAAGDWLVILATWLVLWQAPAWLYPLGLLVIAGRLHALGVVLHDACHMGRRAYTRWLWLLQILAAYPIATTMEAMRYHHLRHHRASGMAEDPYFKAGVSTDATLRMLYRLRGLLLVPVWITRSYVGTVALVVPALRPAYVRFFLQDRSGTDVTGSAEVRACLREEPKQALFFTIVFAAAWHFPAVVGWGYLVPLVVAGAFNVNRVIIEHIHVRCADRRPATVIATTVTHDWGAPGKLFLFPRNIGFHVVHHLYPQAALECLPALQRWHMAQASGVTRQPDARPAKEDAVRCEA
jgi:fatty acid desaturase